MSGRLITVLGPTGSGKSALAIRLAQILGGEVVNCDSVQVYRGFDIGSAKLSVAEREAIPHHLIDIVDCGHGEMTAGEYARQARQVLGEIAGRGRIPVVAGGTGLYLRALLEGLSPAPGRNTELRGRLERVARKKPGFLHAYLARYDERAAVAIHPNDLQKLVRAIELGWSGERTASGIQAAPREPLRGYRVLRLGLDPLRQDLYAKLNARTEAMFSGGLLEETAALLASGVPRSCKPLQSLGYKQALAVLDGVLTQRAALEECQTRTRQYAKRQMTWFRREPDVHWLRGFGYDELVAGGAEDLSRRFLLSLKQ